jgi:purine nucleosidase
VGRRKLILDTDGGIDDAQALIMLVGNGQPPDLITTVFGNVALEAATRNMLAVVATLGASIPVHAGADRGLTQPLIDARHVHGEDGLGGAPRPSHRLEPASLDGVGALRKTFREAAAAGERVDILMIGPLTNLAMALRLEPTILDGIGQLTIMGGTIHGRGNTTPAAEFNIYADPEAAAIVLSEPVDTVIVAWETCVAHYMDGARVDALFGDGRDSGVAAMSRALSNHARQGIVSRGHPDRMFYVDPLAAAAVIDPGIVTKVLSASVGVVLSPGIARGMTLVDPSGRLGTPKHRFVETMDQSRLDSLYATSIAYDPHEAYEPT